MIIKSKVLRLTIIVLPLYILQSILSYMLLDFNSDFIEVAITKGLIILPLIGMGYGLNFVLIDKEDRPKKSEIKKFFKTLLKIFIIFIIVVIILIVLSYFATFGFSNT